MDIDPESMFWPPSAVCKLNVVLSPQAVVGQIVTYTSFTRENTGCRVSWTVLNKANQDLLDLCLPQSCSSGASSLIFDLPWQGNKKGEFPLWYRLKHGVIIALHRQTNMLMESGTHSCCLLQPVFLINITHFQALIQLLIWGTNTAFLAPWCCHKVYKHREIYPVWTRRLDTIFGKMQTYCESQYNYWVCFCVCDCVGRARVWGDEDYPQLTSMQMTSDGHSITSTVSYSDAFVCQEIHFVESLVYSAAFLAIYAKYMWLSNVWKKMSTMIPLGLFVQNPCSCSAAKYEVTILSSTLNNLI